MSLIRISESKDFTVDYDRERGMYRVGILKDSSCVESYWFDCYEERELSSNEEWLRLYFKAYVRGAAELTEYMRKNYPNGIFPSKMIDALKGFCKQFGEIKELDI